MLQPLNGRRYSDSAEEEDEDVFAAGGVERMNPACRTTSSYTRTPVSYTSTA